MTDWQTHRLLLALQKVRILESRYYRLIQLKHNSRVLHSELNFSMNNERFPQWSLNLNRHLPSCERHR